MAWKQDHHTTALIQRRTHAWHRGHGGPRRFVVHTCPSLELPEDWEVEQAGRQFVQKLEALWVLVAAPQGTGSNWFLVASLIANESELGLDDPCHLRARHLAELEMHDPDATFEVLTRNSATLRWTPGLAGASLSSAHLHLSARTVDALTRRSELYRLPPLHLLVGGLSERRVSVVLRRSTTHTIHAWIPLR